MPLDFISVTRVTLASWKQASALKMLAWLMHQQTYKASCVKGATQLLFCQIPLKGVNARK